MDNRENDLKPSIKLFNVVWLGFSFMLMFTGFQTCGMVEQTVLNSYINETTVNSTATYHGSGYTSLAIIYAVFAFANWLAPSIVSILGPKYSMVVGGVTYTLYLSTFIHPVTWSLYVTSVLIGFGAAIIWTGQGNFLTLNSDDDTMGRNSGIFWAMLQCSLLIGNVYVFFAWQGITLIKTPQRVPLFIVLTAICGVGTLSLLVLRPQPKGKKAISEIHQPEPSTAASKDGLQQEDPTSLSTSADEPLLHNEITNVHSVAEPKHKCAEAWEAFLTSVKLFKTKEMLLLSITFFYTGLELTFFSGVYSTSVGGTKAFGSDSDKLVGLTGIMIGVGEILGGGLFGILGKKTVRYGRDPVILFGGVLHMVTFLLIFLNIPDNAPIQHNGTHDVAYISPNTDLAIACAFLLGLADACFNTQCFSILGVNYPENSAAAFALFKFEQSLAAAIGFFYSSHLLLKWQLLILVIFDFLAVLCFFAVERIVKTKAVLASYTVI